MKVKFNMAHPYFLKEDIAKILELYKKILSGKGMLTMGEHVARFEGFFADYTGANYAVATNSGTSALEIALKSLSLQPGDEVIVPAQTFIATASCIVISGGRVVFAEVDNNFLLDFEDLKKKITGKTKAVIIVHFAGLIHPRILEIRDYLKKRDIYLIEDAAHAHGARIGSKNSGNIGDFGCFSFFSTKIMTTGEGGMITTNSRQLYRKCSSLRNRGIDPESANEIFVNAGSNRRLTEFQAILGLYQLKRLELFISKRNEVANAYKTFLGKLKEAGVLDFQNYPENIRHSYWRFIVFIRDRRIKREFIRSKMLGYGIKIDWPYQPLLHLQPVFRKLYGTHSEMLPFSEKMAQTHFCLPVHLGIKNKDAEYIAGKLIKIIND